MLIGAAVGLSSIMLFWGGGLISQSQSDLGSGISESNSRLGEQFEVEDIYWNPDHSNMTFHIRNFGDPPITIDRLLINGADNSSSINTIVVTSRNVGSLTASFTWSSSVVYTFLIGSNRGTYFEIEVTAP
ncbi:hypothetical protein ACFL96_11475 [Thermoproteota archaeon]